MSWQRMQNMERLRLLLLVNNLVIFPTATKLTTSVTTNMERQKRATCTA
jgi:hypothetical protein